jgi:hypothetical protein
LAACPAFRAFRKVGFHETNPLRLLPFHVERAPPPAAFAFVLGFVFDSPTSPHKPNQHQSGLILGGAAVHRCDIWLVKECRLQSPRGTRGRLFSGECEDRECGDRWDVHQFFFRLSGVKKPEYVPSVPTLVRRRVSEVIPNLSS